MALTFTKKIQMSSGDKKMHIYEVTSDTATATINATDLEMNYIDYALVVPVTIPTSITGAAFPALTAAGPSTAVTCIVMSTGSKFAIQAWGW